jgi:hypothetical protein
MQTAARMQCRPQAELTLEALEFGDVKTDAGNADCA